MEMSFFAGLVLMLFCLPSSLAGQVTATAQLWSPAAAGVSSMANRGSLKVTTPTWSTEIDWSTAPSSCMPCHIEAIACLCPNMLLREESRPNTLTHWRSWALSLSHSVVSYLPEGEAECPTNLKPYHICYNNDGVPDDDGTKVSEYRGVPLVTVLNLHRVVPQSGTNPS